MSRPLAASRSFWFRWYLHNQTRLRTTGRGSRRGYGVAVLKPEEVAACLNVGRSEVYQLMRAGALESVRIGACRRVPRAAVDAYIE